jgi:hypothetical protein
MIRGTSNGGRNFNQEVTIEYRLNGCPVFDRIRFDRLEPRRGARHVKLERTRLVYRISRADG